IVCLLSFTVCVDGTLAPQEDVEDLAKVDVAPNLGPLFRRFGDVLQALAEGVAGGGVVLLIEESFAHAEVGKRSAGLGAKSFLVLHDGIVKLALFGKIFATGNEIGRAHV